MSVTHRVRSTGAGTVRTSGPSTDVPRPKGARRYTGAGTKSPRQTPQPSCPGSLTSSLVTHERKGQKGPFRKVFPK